MRFVIIALKVLGILLLLSLLVIASYVAGVGTGIYYSMTPSGDGAAVRIDVAKGTPAGEVADSLERTGVIKKAFLFKVALKLTASEGDLKPGSYLIDPHNNMMEILNQLRTGNFKLRLCTIPEGLTLKEVSVVLEENGIAKSKDLVKASTEKLFYVNGKKLDSIEGFLLPDTYDFPAEYAPEDILKTMIKAFDKEVVPMYERRKDSLPYRLNIRQVVTLASMVEREAQLPKERPIIAMVYYNRLKKGMRMECDATIQYALGKPKEILKFSDLKIKSQYNTYLCDGLPPGPIANPGIESIRATLNPQTVNYFYYVRNDIKNDGSHVFSCTFAEHNEAIRQYQR